MVSIVLEGETAYHNGQYQMLHHERITIAPDFVQSELSGFGDGCAVVDSVASNHPAVVDFERRKDEARRISAYRNRPVTPIFKPERKTRRRKS